MFLLRVPDEYRASLLFALQISAGQIIICSIWNSVVCWQMISHAVERSKRASRIQENRFQTRQSLSGFQRLVTCQSVRVNWICRVAQAKVTRGLVIASSARLPFPHARTSRVPGFDRARSQAYRNPRSASVGMHGL